MLPKIAWTAWAGAAVISSLSGCDDARTSRAEADGRGGEAAVLEALRPKLVDPTSVLLDSLVGTQGVTCGRLDAKARTGAYTGWTGFVLKHDILFIDFQRNPTAKESVDGRSENYQPLFQEYCESQRERLDRTRKERGAEAEKAKELTKRQAERRSEEAAIRKGADEQPAATGLPASGTIPQAINFVAMIQAIKLNTTVMAR